ncbi:hypothetical protein C2W62_30710 [Candidatus Entotheonella serta]|nr:hypothetical protein C2W62_30690 [Candidatus Entotheonella serta]PON14132.1 hypothetical protein C2W62_30710 [Candidatus Entotheonella serta]
METTREVLIGPDFHIGGGAPLALIAGPCAIESQQHALEMAAALKEITAAAEVPFIYKSDTFHLRFLLCSDCPIDFLLLRATSLSQALII